MQYWLVKSEPLKYDWQTFVKDGQTSWDGVRNFQARNNLKAMKINDLVLFYHSNESKAVVGIAQVIQEHYPDPTTTDSNWVAVDLAPVQSLARPVSLEMIKTDNRLTNITLLKQPRLSVMPLTEDEFNTIVALGSTQG